MFSDFWFEKSGLISNPRKNSGSEKPDFFQGGNVEKSQIPPSKSLCFEGILHKKISLFSKTFGEKVLVVHK